MNKIRKYGYRPPPPDEKAYQYGALQVPDEILQPDGSWLDFLPEKEIQNVGGVETYDCTGFGTLNCIETIQRKKYGGTPNYSDRAIGIVAGTGDEGNDPHTVAQAVRHFGLVPEIMLPFSPDIRTLEDYYSPNPLSNDLQAAAKQWLARYTFLHEYIGKPHQEIPHAVLKEALKRSPIGIAVQAWTEGPDGLYQRIGEDNHWTVLIGFDNSSPLIFDSYEDKGSEIKKLRPDYPFYVAKRYYLNRLEQPPKQCWLKSWWQDIWA